MNNTAYVSVGHNKNALQNSTGSSMREYRMTSRAPDWTAASSKPPFAADSTSIGAEADSRGRETRPAAPQSAAMFKNALVVLQNRRGVKFTILLLVWHPGALSIGSMAYDLLVLSRKCAGGLKRIAARILLSADSVGQAGILIL